MTAPTRGCPVDHAALSARRSARGEAPAAPALERDGDTWRLRGYALVRQVLRDADGTTQAGFNAETMGETGLRRPVLFQDGDEHRAQRTAIARFFTPKTVDERYRALMEEASDRIVARLRADGGGRLDELSMDLAVRVASRVVGLTDSGAEAMARRLERLLSLERLQDVNPLRRAAAFGLSQIHLFHFYLRDVRPAIRARRRAPQEDVISHLLEQGYKPLEILIECVTYGAAGMATTREFISMAAWHLLQNRPLRRDYLAAEEAERHRILHEILRLEPVVGHLYRRATREIVLEHAGETHRVPAGALLDLDIRAANADPAAVGEDALQLCPHRELARGVQPPVMSFGDGGHRCPGAFIAIQESDLFLTRLLGLELDVTREPELAWNELIESYELRGFELRVASDSVAADAA